MSTLCTEQNVKDKAGVGASSTVIASSAMLTRFIEESEGVIVSETRRNWVTEYASVNAAVKEILRECCSSHAAKKVLNYDTTGFFSRQAAEITLDVLHDEFTRTLKTLKDLDTVKMRSVT
jgi:hypothetical protein